MAVSKAGSFSVECSALWDADNKQENKPMAKRSPRGKCCQEWEIALGKENMWVPHVCGWWEREASPRGDI